jgi:hypothetical protein
MGASKGHLRIRGEFSQMAGPWDSTGIKRNASRCFTRTRSEVTSFGLFLLKEVGAFLLKLSNVIDHESSWRVARVHPR